MTGHRLLLTLAALLATAPSTWAEGVPPSLEACARISRDSERLGCYDREVARLTGAAPATAPATPSDVFGTRRSAPVLTATPSELAAQREELDEITARVARVTAIGDGRQKVELDNGQVWQTLTTDAGSLFKPGLEVKVGRASMGSFMMTVPGKRSVRVRRIY